MSSTIKLIGILTDVFPTETPTPNFAKKVFWVKEPDTERFPQHWEFELHQQDTGRLQGIAIGDILECEIEVRGKKYHGKWFGNEAIFTTLKCVGIRRVKAVETASGRVGSFKPKDKPGREPDSDRQKPQTELPL